MKTHTAHLSAVLPPDDPRLGYSENQLRTLFGAPFALVDVGLLPRPETVLEPLSEGSRFVNTQNILQGLRRRVSEETLEPPYGTYEGLAFDVGADPFLPYAFGMPSSSAMPNVPMDQIEGPYTEVRADKWSRGGRLVSPFMQSYGLVVPSPSSATPLQILRVATGLPVSVPLPELDNETFQDLQRIKLLELAVSLRQGQIPLECGSDDAAARAEEVAWVHNSSFDALTCARVLAREQGVSDKAIQLYVDAHLVSALCGRFNGFAAPDIYSMADALAETNLAAASLVGPALSLDQATRAYAELHLQTCRVIGGAAPLPADDVALLMMPAMPMDDRMTRYLNGRAQHDDLVSRLSGDDDVVVERFKALASLVNSGKTFASPVAMHLAQHTVKAACKIGIV